MLHFIVLDAFICHSTLCVFNFDTWRTIGADYCEYVKADSETAMQTHRVSAFIFQSCRRLPKTEILTVTVHRRKQPS